MSTFDENINEIEAQYIFKIVDLDNKGYVTE